MEAGLSSSGVMEVADLMLRWEMIKGVDEVGPGLTSMSPARRRISVSRLERSYVCYDNEECDWMVL